MKKIMTEWRSFLNESEDVFFLDGDNSYVYKFDKDTDRYFFKTVEDSENDWKRVESQSGIEKLNNQRSKDDVGLRRIDNRSTDSETEDEEESVNNNRFSAIVYNQGNAKVISGAVDGLIKKYLPKFIQDGFISGISKIPQGHAGIIMIDAAGNARKIDFGANNGYPCRDNNIPIFSSMGFFILGGVIDKIIGKVNLIEKTNLSSETIKRLVKSASPHATDVLIIEDFDYETAYAFATTPKCRPYALIPGVYDGLGTTPVTVSLEGDNCGSFAYKVSLFGSGVSASTLAGAALNRLLFAPDQVIPLLRVAGIGKVFDLAS